MNNHKLEFMLGLAKFLASILWGFLCCFGEICAQGTWFNLTLEVDVMYVCLSSSFVGVKLKKIRGSVVENFRAGDSKQSW